MNVKPHTGAVFISLCGNQRLHGFDIGIPGSVICHINLNCPAPETTISTWILCISPSYPCMMQLVTASDTAVLQIEISSSVGFSCVRE